MQKLISILTTFVQDDLLITLSVGAGCVMLASYLKKRSFFGVRVVLSFLTVAAWMIFTSAIIPHVAPLLSKPWPLLGILRYGGVFVLSGMTVFFMSEASFCQALYAVTVAYSLQNMCERIIEIPRYSVPSFPLLFDRICLAILMGLCLLIYHRLCFSSTSKRPVFDFSNMNSIIMLLLGVGVLVISVGMDTYLRGHTPADNLILRNSLHIMSALFSLLTVVVSMSHVRETDSERRARVATQMLNAERSRYEQEKNIHDVINVKCHDIRHQIAALGAPGYEKELRKIGKLVDIYDSTPRTQCIALDVALSSKALACRSQNIALTCLADGRSLGFMEDSDIYALFGNILDNAIEAVLQIDEPDKRQISLTVSNRDGLLLIEEENFFSGSLTFELGLPVTTKTDSDFHGFGTRSIQILTDKYGGDLRMHAEDGIFRLSIMLPIAAAA